MKHLDKKIDKKLREGFEQVLKGKAPNHIWANINDQLEADLNQGLDEKVKEGFEQAPLQKAPPLLWTSIAVGLDKVALQDDSLDQKLKDGFEHIPIQKAPPKAWKTIQRQLNIDQTWTNISDELDKAPPRTQWTRRLYQVTGVAAAMLLLPHTCDYNSIIHNNSNQQTIANKTSTQKQSSSNSNQKPNSATYRYHTKQNTNNSSDNDNKTINAKEPVPSSHTKDTKINTDINASIANQNGQPIAASTNNWNASSANNVTKNGLPIIAETTKNGGFEKKCKKNAKKMQAVPTLATTEASYERKKDTKGDINENIITDVSENNQGDEEVEETGVINSVGNSATTNTKEEKELNWAVLEAIKRQPLAQDNSLPEKVIALIEEPTLENKKTSPIKDKLKVGAFVVVNSTMLLNQETREGFRTPDKVKNYFGVAANYGLWASYQIIPKGAIVAEFSINADNKQGYGVYDAGVFYIKEWVMKYNRISVAYQHDLFLTDGKKIDTKIVAQAGLYLGILREAKLFYDGELFFDAIGEHNRFDFGFKVALGQEIDFGRLVLGYGIRSDIGASNIFSGNNNVSAQENYTNVIHLGGYMTLGYKF